MCGGGWGGGIAISDSTDLLFNGIGFRWAGLFHDYKNFHGRMVAQMVAMGSPEATEQVTTLEDLGSVPPGFSMKRSAVEIAVTLDGSD